MKQANSNKDLFAKNQFKLQNGPCDKLPIAVLLIHKEKLFLFTSVKFLAVYGK